MTIHLSEQAGVAAEVAVALLRAAKELDPAADLGLVEPFAMRVPRAEERQERQAAHAGVGLSAGAAAILPEDIILATRAVTLGVPAAILRLSSGEPVERRVVCAPGRSPGRCPG